MENNNIDTQSSARPNTFTGVILRFVTSAVILAITAFFTPGFTISNVWSLALAAVVLTVIDYLIEEVGLDMKEVIKMLNKESGLLGVSGVSSDFRDVQEAAANGNERAQLALDIFFRRVIAYIGRYFIALGGVDAICFTAGIGENSFFARKEICNLLAEALGIEIDDDANVNGKGDRLISTPNSKVKVYVIPTNEELVIARDTKRLLNL